MRRFALGLVLVLSALPGCGPGAECAVDTDCPFASGAYCSADHVCVPRGTGGDTGTRDGGTSDVGPRDAPVGDAPRVDAPADAPSMDDAGACPDVVATYMLTSVGIGCSALTESAITLMTPTGACVFPVSLDSRAVGTVTPTDDTHLSGTLAIPTADTACTLTFSTDYTMLDVSCGPCALTAMRR